MVALFLLSQVFLIVSHGPLVHTLAAVMLMSDFDTIQTGTIKVLEKFGDATSNKFVTLFSSRETLGKCSETLTKTLSTSEERHYNEELCSDVRNTKEFALSSDMCDDSDERESDCSSAFRVSTTRVLRKSGNVAPSNKSVASSSFPREETFEKSPEVLSETPSTPEEHRHVDSDTRNAKKLAVSTGVCDESEHPSTSFDLVNTPARIRTPLDTSIPSEEDLEEIKHLNVTDEEKQQRLALESPLTPHLSQNDVLESLAKKPFLETIVSSLLCVENDYAALFTLCLLYALANNQVNIRKTLR